MTCGLLHVLAELRFIIKLINGPLRISCHMWKWVKMGEFFGKMVTAKLDEKYADKKCHKLWDTLRRNVTVVNCHSRGFVGWALRLGWNVAWSVRGWTDRQRTPQYLCWREWSPPLSREDQVDLRTASLCSAETGHIYIVGRPLLSDDLGTVQDEVITSITPPPPHILPFVLENWPVRVAGEWGRSTVIINGWWMEE
jgi:hypothetical protein